MIIAGLVVYGTGRRYALVRLATCGHGLERSSVSWLTTNCSIKLTGTSS